MNTSLERLQTHLKTMAYNKTFHFKETFINWEDAHETHEDDKKITLAPFSECIYVKIFSIKSFMGRKHHVYLVLSFLNVFTIYLGTSSLFLDKSYPFIPIFMIFREDMVKPYICRQLSKFWHFTNSSIYWTI